MPAPDRPAAPAPAAPAPAAPAPAAPASPLGGRAQQILTAAEELFARNGFSGTTMREIAKQAGVGLSLVVYHFETKLKLYEAVFAARRHVNQTRLDRLRAVTDLTGPDALERVVGALIDPVLELLDDPAQKWYLELVFRQLGDPWPEQWETMGAMFNPLAQEFVAALRVVLPDRPPAFHPWAYLFALGALSQISQDRRATAIGTTPSNSQKDDDTTRDDDKIALLRHFIIAGLRH